MKNILTIDFEDWYQDTKFKYWDNYENRIVQNTNKLLSVLNEMKTIATFFIVGYNAEQFPQLIENIKDNGHEIGIHGYCHMHLSNQNSAEFKEDLSKSIHILEKISDGKIRSYRAPYFSLTEETSWILDIIKEKRIKNDSSIFPVKTHLYGIPKAPRFPYYVSSSNLLIEDDNENLLEFPISTYRLPFSRYNIPIGGGFYLRFFPYRFIKHAIKKINKEKQPSVFYFHPWELDPNQPRIKSYKWWKYYNLDKSERKLMKLLKDFKFTSIEEYVDNLT
ncbi:MAG: DUF3473 domain-containing protein [Thermoplasmatales archaeon]|nr:MAG: DUF3473 domain-containing protein [Thermoplasmatales archaeon]